MEAHTNNKDTLAVALTLINVCNMLVEYDSVFILYMHWRLFPQRVHCNLTICMIYKLMNVHENENQCLNRVNRLFQF